MKYEQIIGETLMTDAGEYTIVKYISDGGSGDENITLYFGRSTSDGHHDLIASDNASMWVVGDENDKERNHAQWDLIVQRCGDVAPVLDEVRESDPDLADWLADRIEEAKRTVLIYKGDCLPDDGCADDVEVSVSGEERNNGEIV